MIVVQWDMRANGREVGDEELVDRTPFIEACIEQGRVRVIWDEADGPRPAAVVLEEDLPESPIEHLHVETPIVQETPSTE